MNKKLATGAAAGVIVLAGSGIAFAYWTASGSGTGSASTSTGASDLSIDQTSLITDLAPGSGPQDIEGTVTNDATTPAYVASVTVSIASVTTASGVTGTCGASDYAITGATMTVNQELAASGGSFDFSGAAIEFVNKTTNQDACKGATVNLLYTAA